ncbi:MAG TPA: SsrA-binding protein [Proteobacteria bacterium]|jgi:SsrA-binding protein|nr:SsrA-binding protein [Pseudomonadota bacterium]|tara:strand:+ start:775 stop:1254 length:480 start_codon:yes stop_codon:yes gene_type:complete
MNTNKPQIIELIKNKKAYHDYLLEDKFTAGLVLEGWEVKAIRQHKINLSDSHVIIRQQECFLIGAHVTPLPTTANYLKADPTRTRKLLLQRREISKLVGAVQQKGYTIVPCSLFLKDNLIKIQVALAKGKKHHDKRQAEKEKSWKREKQQLLKNQIKKT